MTQAWSDEVAAYLLRTDICPRCGTARDATARCSGCGADLGGDSARAVFRASLDAAESVKRRQLAIDALPELASAVATTPPPPTADTLVREPVAAGGVPAAPATSSVSVQSVLAVAGAGLLAVAAIVFAFFNPDLTDFATRTLIIGAVTVVFLGSAWLLARVRLQFSAEVIGALGMVFVTLDIWAFSNNSSLSGWAYAALGTLASSVVMIVIAVLARIRSWLWAGLVGVAITPAFLGYAVDHSVPAVHGWATAVGHLAVGFVALGLTELARRLGPRFSSGLAADRATQTVLRMAVVLVVLGQVPFLPSAAPGFALGATALIAALAVLAVFSARHEPRIVWSFAAAALLATALCVLTLALPSVLASWYLALLPGAAGVAVLLLSLLPSPTWVNRVALLVGAWSVALAVAIPSGLAAVLQVVFRDRIGLNERDGLAVLLGTLALAAGTASLWLLARRSLVTARLARVALAVGLWTGLLAPMALVGWSQLPALAQAIAGLGLAVGLALALTRVARVTGAPLVMRLPLIVGAHLLVALAAATGWSDDALKVGVGAASVAALFGVARTVPIAGRAVHVGVGFAYALIVFAAGLNLVHLEIIAVLCLTTALAAVSALVVTLVPRIRPSYWYAVLIVTAVPFLIGVGSVLAVRSGWTALSTGVTFLLALTLLLTRRPGLGRLLRTVAAALLVPALAVVIVCLGAQVLDVSGSPVALPIVAVLVAGVLPTTGIIELVLERHGIPVEHGRFARVAIELSSLVTAALAVLLSLVRSAAGLDTTFLVLVILGIGAAATAVFAKRRYGWPLAAVSFTGALWCVWALAGVGVAEPYILPPALLAAIVGAVLVARGRPGVGIPAIGLYSVGLAVAVLPSLAILTVAGFGVDGRDSWRVLALMATAVLLLVLGTLAGRVNAGSRVGLLRRLQLPTLAIGIAAAASGAVQSVRFGWRLDPIEVSDDQLLLPVLGISVAAAVVAGLCAALLVRLTRPTRWWFAPAFVYLVVGPMMSVRDATIPIVLLFGLSLALLAVMVVVAALGRTRFVPLPPIWFLFLLAWLTAVSSWSMRDIFRVDAYALPMGAALLVVGVLYLRAPATAPQRTAGSPSLNSWPLGFHGSWRLLTPGIVVAFLPSMLSTGTDPQTWRAILVLGLALVSILIGSLRKLAAPFLLGIIVLPLENIIVFAVQLGRGIGATPWWITLATAGAVLLVIAVTSERRTSGETGVAARLRDLT